MLTRYIEAGMDRARFEWLPETHVYYGEIPELPGVWATGDTIDECRDELREVLQDWIVLGLSIHSSLPVLDGIDVNVEAVH